tara:strand:- start:2303 stop:2665 length:363 start_codon:yes stop_codon:yes gene_type:complete
MTTVNTIYSYSKCGTCRKALKWLEKKEIKYELIDIIENPPGKEIIEQAFNHLGTSKPFFNTSGKSYRALGAKNVLAMSREEQIKALASDGKLIKRPLLITSNEEILIGFKEKEWEEILIQ